MSFWKKHKPKKAVENLDSTPVAMPVKFHRPPTLQEQMQAFTRRQLNGYAKHQGKETFEEANDFDTGDDDDIPRSPHEIEFDEKGEREFELFASQQFEMAEKKRQAKQAKQQAEDTPPNSTPPL